MILFTFSLFYARRRLDLNSENARPTWCMLWSSCDGEWVILDIWVILIIWWMFSVCLSVVYGAWSSDSFVVVHFRPITIVVKLHSSRVALVLVNLPRLAVQAIGRKTLMWLWIMLHQVVHRSGRELRFTREAKVRDFLSIKISPESRRDCIGLCDVLWNVTRHSWSICLSVVVKILVILMIAVVHDFGELLSISRTLYEK